MKVYITKYATTHGILVRDAEIQCDFPGTIFVRNSAGDLMSCGEGHWFLSLEDARIKAMRMVNEKIRTVEVQLEKLTKLRTDGIPVQEEVA